MIFRGRKFSLLIVIVLLYRSGKWKKFVRMITILSCSDESVLFERTACFSMKSVAFNDVVSRLLAFRFNFDHKNITVTPFTHNHLRILFDLNWKSSYFVVFQLSWDSSIRFSINYLTYIHLFVPLLAF